MALCVCIIFTLRDYSQSSFLRFNDSVTLISPSHYTIIKVRYDWSVLQHDNNLGGYKVPYPV